MPSTPGRIAACRVRRMQLAQMCPTLPARRSEAGRRQATARVAAGARVSDEVVYKYVKAIAENEARVQAIGGSLKTSFAASKRATNPANLPYPPGALRYYKERGLVK